jgi:cell division protease FtsH
MQKVDAEIRRIVDEQYALARKLIEENKDKIEAMTQALLEWETIDSDQIKDIMEGRPPRPPKPPQSTIEKTTEDVPPVETATGKESDIPPQEAVKGTD